MTLLRFGPRTKIADRHYVRQDSTMSYFFTKEEVEKLDLPWITLDLPIGLWNTSKGGVFTKKKE